MKFKFILMLFAIAFSSASIQAESESGREQGWHFLQKQNKKFIKDPKFIKQRKKTQGGQNPNFVVLTCADSRTTPEFIFNAKIGEIFCPRVAGNTAGDQVIDSIAFAVKTWDVTTVVVMGHENCGAVIGALDHLRDNGGVVDPENGIFNAVLIPIEKAIVAAGIDIYGPNALEEATKANVVYAAQQLINKSTIISNALANGQIIIVGSIYSLKSGKARELFVWKK